MTGAPAGGIRLLHTADWHVGKALRGRSRHDEHEAVLSELVGLADSRRVDVVLVAGDLFDTAAPTPEAERIVFRALLDLAAGGRPVVVVAGNHDSSRRLAALAPVFGPSGVHVLAEVVSAARGGVVDFDVRGTRLEVALVPFLSQRHVVRSDDLMERDADEHAGTYAHRARRIVEALTSAMDDDSVQVLLAHAMVAGGVGGGGERSPHLAAEYALDATAFPPGLHYVALGHLHRTQQVPGPCPIWYPGSPLALDFGEEGNRQHALVVELAHGTPAQVERVPLTSGRPLRTVRGTLAEMERVAGEIEGASCWMRVVLEEVTRVGLADEVRVLFPDAVEVTIPTSMHAVSRAPIDDVEQLDPSDLFAGYLEEARVDDPRLVALFDELYDEAVSRAT